MRKCLPHIEERAEEPKLRNQMLWSGWHGGERPTGWETPNMEPRNNGSKNKTIILEHGTYTMYKNIPQCTKSSPIPETKYEFTISTQSPLSQHQTSHQRFKPRRSGEWMGGQNEGTTPVLLLPPENGKPSIFHIPSESSCRSCTEPIIHFCFTPFTSDIWHACLYIVSHNVDVEGPMPTCCKHNTLLSTYDYKIGFNLRHFH